MANIKSAKKRNRQSEKRRSKNVQVKSSVRKSAKKVILATESKDAAELQSLTSLFKQFVTTIDTAARKKVVHWKTAARKKSRLARKINAATQK